MTIATAATAATIRVSTHMPLARHDDLSDGCIGSGVLFLLTCLLRGMTRFARPKSAKPTVSTHMPLARHD